MAEQGGYRKPKNPAAVSGPGRMSRRTDGQPSEGDMKQAKRYISGGDYGEGKELMNIQGSAPMAKAPGVPDSMSPATSPTTATPPIPKSNVPNLLDPSAKPSEPITSGIAGGPGIGPEGMTPVSPMVPSAEDMEKTRAMYALLMRASQSPNASQATRELARKIRGYLI